MKLISIGCCCELTRGIQQLPDEYKTFNSPFEWCYTDTFDIITNLITTNFAGFTDCKRKTILYPDGSRAAQGNCLKQYDMFVGHYKNKWGNIGPRRAERFMNLIKTSDEKLIFVRKSHLHNRIITQEVDDFKKCIVDINPELNFEVLIVNEFLTTDTVFTVENCIYYPLINESRHGMWIKFEKILNDFVSDYVSDDNSL